MLQPSFFCLLSLVYSSSSSYISLSLQPDRSFLLILSFHIRPPLYQSTTATSYSRLSTLTSTAPRRPLPSLPYTTDRLYRPLPPAPTVSVSVSSQYPLCIHQSIHSSHLFSTLFRLYYISISIIFRLYFDSISLLPAYFDFDLQTQ